VEESKMEDAMVWRIHLLEFGGGMLDSPFCKCKEVLSRRGATAFLLECESSSGRFCDSAENALLDDAVINSKERRRGGLTGVMTEDFAAMVMRLIYYLLR
jgi:hypothetical protein